MTLGSRSIWIAAFLLVGHGASALGRAEPQEKCAASKTRASALAVFAQVRCAAKAASKGTAVDVTCLQKTESKLRARFAKADSKGTCLGNDDAALLSSSACATAFSDAISGDARCVARKLKAVGTRTRAAVGCARKAAAKGSDAATCLAKVETKFRAAMERAHAQGTCTGTAEELAALSDQCLLTLGPPTPCAESGHPSCGGACADGLACGPFETFANGVSVETGCSCVDVSNGPQCGGIVCAENLQCPDPGFVCERWTAGDPLACDHTICQPAMVTPTTLPPTPENQTPCDGGEFPTCGGTCPNGMRCQSFQALYEGFSFFAGCLCVDPTAPRCEATTDCDLRIIPFSHCADPSLTCLVTLEIDEARDTAPTCSNAQCGAGIPTTTSTSNTNTTTTTGTTPPPSTTSTSTSTSTSTTTTTLPCTSTPAVSGCFQDLGDCTILDTCTGLQWEQKGEIPGPHHVNNRYVWAGCCEDGCQTMCQPNEAAAATCMAMAEAGTDGCTAQCPTGTCFVERAGAVTTIFDWINRLNAENFAGHGDWRVPTEAGFNPTGTRELESILAQPCTSQPCIDSIFGPTANARYWSRTGDVNRSVDAWYVDFFSGEYGNLIKREPLFVRAVR